MKANNWKVKKYINEVGYYASIDLEVEYEDLNGLKINFCEEFVDDVWRSAVEFGIRYVKEHSISKSSGLSVNVKKLHTMTGDSSQAVVFYTTVKCLCELLEYKDELIILDEERGSFILLK